MAKNQDQPQDSQDVAVSATTGTVVTRTHLDAFHELMRQRAGIVAQERNEDVMLKQSLLILAAAESGDVSEIESADMGGAIQGRDVDGLEVEIRGFEPVISTRDDIESPQGYYVSCDAVVIGGPREMLTRYGLKLGQEFVLQSGAQLFVLKVAGLEQAGAFPYRGVVRAIKTQSDRTVVKLFPAPERVR
jgi:hypothetical protein